MCAMSSTPNPSVPEAQEAPAGPRALVIGASSGIGAALVQRMVGEGYAVAGLARRMDRLERLRSKLEDEPGALHVYEHDVADRDAVPELFERVVRDLGGLDVIVYVAGIMPKVEADEYDTAKDAGQVEVNLTGAMAWCNPAARLFQTQRAGTIVGVGSVAGDRGRKQNPAYHATKAAFATYLESLRNRLAGYGVRVVTIKPGPVETDMTAGMDDLPLMISADAAAKAILKASRGGLFDVRYVPRAWWPIMGVIRAIPSALFRHLNV